MPKDPNPPAPILDHNDPRILPRQRPTIATKAVNLAKAAKAVTSAAIKGEQIVVSREELNRRDKICNACNYWKPSGNLGMGECTHNQCGCTKFKLGLATETCPAKKW